ncbi:MAG: hypothetical protein IKO98_07805, partial [Bacteroidales bacterium]|nr:hypothetical protein [Bacteroidales bacterium]
MEDFQNNNELTFKEEQDNSFGLKDAVAIFLRNIHWFMLSVLVCMTVAVYRVHKTVPVYSRSTVVVLRLNSSSSTQYGRDFQYASSRYTSRMGMVNTDLNNEIIILKSRPIIAEMIHRLGLETGYYYLTGIMNRQTQLYTQSPVKVEVLESNEYSDFEFKVIPLDENTVQLTGFSNSAPLRVSMGKVLRTPVGRLVITPTITYGPAYYKKEIYVHHYNIENLVNYYCNAIQVNRVSDDNTLIRLALNDVLPTRAEEILSTLLNVYNEGARNDKQKVIEMSAQFIDDRLLTIDQELEGVENSLDSFKVNHHMLDFGSFGSEYRDQRMSYTNEKTSLENELVASRYMLEQVRSMKDNSLIALNTGVSPATERAIEAYNQKVLDLQRYEAGGTTNNPFVQNLY